MKVKTEEHINDNGSYTKTTIRTKTSEDGFVPHSEMHPASMTKYGKFHKGNTTVKSFTTNDPRITRPFAYSVCGVFTVIGIVLILFSGIMLKIMGIFFLVIGIFGFTKSKKDIDRVKEELKKKKAK